QHCVAVRIGAGYRLGADIASGAALVLDHHLLAPDLGQPVGNDAGNPVGSAAGRERDDQADVTVRPVLRAGAANEGGCECGSGAQPGQRGAGDHACPPCAPYCRGGCAVGRPPLVVRTGYCGRGSPTITAWPYAAHASVTASQVPTPVARQRTPRQLTTV